MLSQVLKEQPIREPNTLWKRLLSATDISFPSAASTLSGRWWSIRRDHRLE